MRSDREMEKIFCSDDFPEVLSASDTGRAMMFFDAADKITKSASDAVNREIIQQFRPPSNMQGVHLVTMGAEEDYGYNRNGDSASRRSLREYHPTFTKFGSVYREHKNKGPRYSFGDVKYETYNEKARRGELIIWFDKDKAPDMAKKAANNEELSWSMSMRLPFDRCSICDNKARTRANYCNHLRGNLRNYDEGMKKYAYARNEDNVKFFDISEVEKRADRIAAHLSYFGSDEMNKAASIDRIIGGAEWAELYKAASAGAFLSIFDLMVLEKIAARDIPVLPNHVTQSFAPRDLPQDQIEILRGPDFRSVAGELLKKAMLLAPRTFAAIVTGQSIDSIEKDATFDESLEQLPEIMNSMSSSGCGCCDEDLGKLVTPDQHGCSFSPGGDSIDRLIKEVGENLGMDDENIFNRASTTIVVKNASIKNQSNEKDLWDATMNAYAFYLAKSAYILDGRISSMNMGQMLRGIVL